MSSSVPLENSKRLYQILCIPDFSSSEEVRSAYKTLVLRYHPDKNLDDPNAADKFREVRIAYEVLSGEEKKKRYDANLRVFKAGLGFTASSMRKPGSGTAMSSRQQYSSRRSTNPYSSFNNTNNGNSSPSTNHSASTTSTFNATSDTGTSGGATATATAGNASRHAHAGTSRTSSAAGVGSKRGYAAKTESSMYTKEQQELFRRREKERHAELKRQREAERRAQREQEREALRKEQEKQESLLQQRWQQQQQQRAYAASLAAAGGSGAAGTRRRGASATPRAGSASPPPAQATATTTTTTAGAAAAAGDAPSSMSPTPSTTGDVAGGSSSNGNFSSGNPATATTSPPPPSAADRTPNVIKVGTPIRRSVSASLRTPRAMPRPGSTTGSSRPAGPTTTTTTAHVSGGYGQHNGTPRFDKRSSNGNALGTPAAAGVEESGDDWCESGVSPRPMDPSPSTLEVGEETEWAFDHHDNSSYSNHDTIASSSNGQSCNNTPPPPPAAPVLAAPPHLASQRHLRQSKQRTFSGSFGTSTSPRGGTRARSNLGGGAVPMPHISVVRGPSFLSATVVPNLGFSACGIGGGSASGPYTPRPGTSGPTQTGPSVGTTPLQPSSATTTSWTPRSTALSQDDQRLLEKHRQELRAKQERERQREVREAEQEKYVKRMARLKKVREAAAAAAASLSLEEQLRFAEADELSEREQFIEKEEVLARRRLLRSFWQVAGDLLFEGPLKETEACEAAARRKIVEKATVARGMLLCTIREQSDRCYVGAFERRGRKHLMGREASDAYHASKLRRGKIMLCERETALRGRLCAEASDTFCSLYATAGPQSLARMQLLKTEAQGRQDLYCAYRIARVAASRMTSSRRSASPDATLLSGAPQSAVGVSPELLGVSPWEEQYLSSSKRLSSSLASGAGMSSMTVATQPSSITTPHSTLASTNVTAVNTPTTSPASSATSKALHRTLKGLLHAEAASRVAIAAGYDRALTDALKSRAQGVHILYREEKAVAVTLATHSVNAELAVVNAELARMKQLLYRMQQRQQQQIEETGSSASAQHQGSRESSPVKSISSSVTALSRASASVSGAAVQRMCRRRESSASLGFHPPLVNVTCVPESEMDAKKGRSEGKGEEEEGRSNDIAGVAHDLNALETGLATCSLSSIKKGVSNFATEAGLSTRHNSTEGTTGSGERNDSVRSLSES